MLRPVGIRQQWWRCRQTKNEPDPFRSALEMALQHRRPKPGLILHHDRGSQYTGARFRAKAETAKIRLSMPYDNAMAESFFATLKLELMEGAIYSTREHARQAIFEYLEIFYNRIRMHSSLGYRSPLQAEREYLLTKSVS